MTAPQPQEHDTDVQAVADALAGLNSPGEVRALFEEILTPAERQTIALRWKLMRMLRQGVPQRRISEHLGISLCKITRGSRVLKEPGSIMRRLLDAESLPPAPPRQEG